MGLRGLVFGALLFSVHANAMNCPLLIRLAKSSARELGPAEKRKIRDTIKWMEFLDSAFDPAKQDIFQKNLQGRIELIKGLNNTNPKLDEHLKLLEALNDAFESKNMEKFRKIAMGDYMSSAEKLMETLSSHEREQVLAEENRARPKPKPESQPRPAPKPATPPTRKFTFRTPQDVDLSDPRTAFVNLTRAYRVATNRTKDYQSLREQEYAIPKSDRDLRMYQDIVLGEIASGSINSNNFNAHINGFLENLEKVSMADAERKKHLDFVALQLKNNSGRSSYTNDQLAMIGTLIKYAGVIVK